MKLNRVLKNASWIIACRLAQAVFALIINALTARYFGPTNYGVINYAASLVAFVTPIMKLGTSDILVSEIIKAPEKEGNILGTSIVMTLVSSFVCILGLFAFVTLANTGDTTTNIVVILYSLLLVAQSIEQIQYWFHAKYLSKIVSIVSLAIYLLVSLYRAALLVLGKNIYWFAISNAIDHLIIAIVLLVIYKIKNDQKLQFSTEAFREIWANGRHYIVPELMGLVLVQSDKIMLRFMCGDGEVGLYSSALYVATMTSFVFNAIVVSYRPLILESKINNEEMYRHNMVKLYGIIICFSLLQCVGITIFSHLCINILYGEAYIQSVPMLRIAIWYTLFSYIGSVRTVWILAESKQRYLWIISFFGMLLNVLLNYFFIDLWGGKGAALATVFTQIFTNIVIIYLIKPLRPNIIYILESLHVKKWIGLKNKS